MLSPEPAMEGVFTITTAFDKYKIKQTIYGDVGKYITINLLDTSEAEIRKALIAMGWTPPKDNKEGLE